MFKEMQKNVVDINLESAPILTSKSVIMKFLPPQDTTKIIKTNVQRAENEPQLKQNVIAPAKINAIHKADSVSKKINVTHTINYQNIKTETPLGFNIKDTSSIRVFKNDGYELKAEGKNFETSSNNFLLAIPQKNISQHYNELVIGYINATKTEKNETFTTVQKPVVQKEFGFDGNLKAEASLNWLPGILLLSLFTFSWVKLAYQKYVVQVVTSIVNYQVSLRLLREKNVLFRNMAIGLNFVFAVNLGLLIFYYLLLNNLNQVNSSNFLSVIIYSSGIIFVYNIKTFLCKILGNIFLVKEQFAEYVHNIHLYNKNLGLFLFPIVIVFPYITDIHVKTFVLYLGFIIFIGVFLMLIYRGIQIIMRNGVSTFYLILYLCAIEILPILLLIKYSYTLI